MFSALAEGHGNLKDKVNMFVALAPVVYMGNAEDDLLNKVSAAAEILYDSFARVKVYELFGHEWYEYSSVVCSFFHSFCEENGINMDPITPYVNEWRTRVKNTREGPGASVKQLLHYA